ncbi:MAG: hypothetical protein BGP04_19410 [Rhizobiales bacterium 62-17]|nr:tetratricopeptide repeat protein [Hyphomicrobiales bacterium]OJX99833.1 MAG: hypothetical protein BGP04_19410 [Rhizobiales bacterium 62-17]
MAAKISPDCGPANVWGRGDQSGTRLGRWIQRQAVTALGAAFLVLSTASSQAQTAQRAEFEQLFQASLRNPSDAALAFRFAEVASQIQDYEAAIGALERILFYNSTLGRVRLELGILYFRLGSYAQAKSYLETVLAEPNVPFEVRARVQPYLTEIERRNSRHGFQAFAQIGVRHQSNANAGPDGGNVRIFGFDGQISQNFARRPDWNLFALGGMRYVYDFDNQRGDTWETLVQGYATRQNRFTQLDVLLGEINTGPRLAILPDVLTGWTFRPYVIANGFQLGGNPYMRTLGYGASVAAPTPFGGIIEVGAESRRRTFSNSFTYPTAFGQTGRLDNAYATFVYPVAPWARLNLRAVLGRNASIESYNSFNQNGFEASLSMDFEPPFAAIQKRWTVTPFVSRYATRYTTPNIIIDPFVRRNDIDWRAGVAFDMPVHENFGFGAQLVWSKTTSSLANYRTNNFTIVMGPTARY